MLDSIRNFGPVFERCVAGLQNCCRDLTRLLNGLEVAVPMNIHDIYTRVYAAIFDHCASRKKGAAADSLFVVHAGDFAHWFLPHFQQYLDKQLEAVATGELIIERLVVLTLQDMVEHGPFRAPQNREIARILKQMSRREIAVTVATTAHVGIANDSERLHFNLGAYTRTDSDYTLLMQYVPPDPGKIKRPGQDVMQARLLLRKHGDGVRVKNDPQELWERARAAGRTQFASEAFRVAPNQTEKEIEEQVEEIRQRILMEPK